MPLISLTRHLALCYVQGSALLIYAVACQWVCLEVCGCSLPLRGQSRIGDAVLRLGIVFVFNSFSFLFCSSSFWDCFAIIHANVSEVTCSATAALVLLGWAVTVVTVFLLAAVVAAVCGHLGHLQALLIGGHDSDDLLLAVEDNLGALGSFSGHRHLERLLECEVLLCQEVLLELHVIKPSDEQALDDRLTEVIHLLAGRDRADQFHVT